MIASCSGGWASAPLWLAYRRARRPSYTLAGRNPLGSRARPLSWGQEWQSVQGLLGALAKPPRVVERASDGLSVMGDGHHGADLDTFGRQSRLRWRGSG